MRISITHNRYFQLIVAMAPLLCVLRSPCVQAQTLTPACEDIFVSSDRVVERINEMTAVEQQIETWRDRAGQIDRRMDIEANLRLERLKFHLRAREVKPAIDIYRELFRTVEFDIFRVQEIESRLESASVVGFQSDALVQLAAERLERLREFGMLYGEYVQVRTFLETETAGDRSDRNDSAKRIFAALGIHNLRSLFPSLNLHENRVPLEVVKRMFRESPDALMAMLDRDLKEERRAAAYAFVQPLINASQSLVYRLPTAIRQPVSQLVGLNYENYLRRTYIPQIARVMRVDDDIEAKLQLLMALDSTSPRNELIGVFARLIHGEEEWVQIMDHAKSIRDRRPLVATFVEDMERAQALAKKSGPLSLFDKGGGSQRAARKTLILSALIAGLIASYGNDWHLPIGLDKLDFLRRFAEEILHEPAPNVPTAPADTPSKTKTGSKPEPKLDTKPEPKNEQTEEETITGSSDPQSAASSIAQPSLD